MVPMCEEFKSSADNERESQPARPHMDVWDCVIHGAEMEPRLCWWQDTVILRSGTETGTRSVVVCLCWGDILYLYLRH